METAVSGPQHIAIAIVSFRNPGDITKCLAALATSTWTDFTVYVCENGGDAAYENLCAAIPDRLPSGQSVVRINAGDNLGYAGGVNRCIRAIEGDYRAVWVLNPDTEPEAGALTALLARLDRNDVDAVGGVVLLNETYVQSYGGLWRPWLGFGASMGLGTDPALGVDAAEIERNLWFLSGASMLVTREFIRKVGPMQDDYFLYAEEVEWFLRARQKGMKLGFTPDARVFHGLGTTTGWHGGDFKTWPRMPIYLDARNRVRMTAQLTPLLLPTALLGIVAHGARRYLRKGANAQFGYLLQGVAAGLRGESGRPAWVK
ncbi:MAG: glycosyltransferase family 2 protein [Phenylobacterium zucineum]|nr:MAG: glycosyltransferase family 2 protein [Phenylobacterium zucineum]